MDYEGGKREGRGEKEWDRGHGTLSTKKASQGKEAAYQLERNLSPSVG